MCQQQASMLVHTIQLLPVQAANNSKTTVPIYELSWVGTSMQGSDIMIIKAQIEVGDLLSCSCLLSEKTGSGYQSTTMSSFKQMSMYDRE